MKRKLLQIIIPAVLLAPLMIISCELDNFDGPDAQISGKIIDIETGELVQTNIIKGTTIKLLEHGYDPVTPQYLKVKTDGTYTNNFLFANTYTVQPDLRNFVQIDTQVVKIGKNTKLDFEVLPYIRIKNTKIVKEGNNVIATFNLQQTTDDPVSKIALFAYADPNVGDGAYNVVAEETLNKKVGEDETFKLVINIARNTSLIKLGKPYFFRVGACSGFGGAQFNYSSVERIEIDEIVPEVEPEGILFDDCESIEGWLPKPELDSEDPREGKYSVKFHAEKEFIIQKNLNEPIEVGVDMEHGIFQFDLFISDVSIFDWGFAGQIEISSSGLPDNLELNWPFTSERRLVNGWNRVILKLSEAGPSGGNIDLNSVNFFRIYHLSVNGSVDLKLDNLKFYEEE